MPVLMRVFPQGLIAHDPEVHRTLRQAHEEWEESLEARRRDPAVHGAWVEFILKTVLELKDEVIATGQAIQQTWQATVGEEDIARPDLVIKNPVGRTDAGQPRLFVQIYPANQDLEKRVAGKSSPDTRMAELLRNTGVRLGLVTNGHRWMLVNVLPRETAGFASWYDNLWIEEPITLRAFRSLLSMERFFGVADKDTLEAMLAESALNQQDVTDQLGYQVRRAVEVLIQSLDQADQDHGRELLGSVAEAELYEAALTVMMRLVILFCAEERGLLLLGDPLFDQHYAVSTLRAQLRETADQHGEEVLERRHDAWCRLLSTFRAVYGGVEHERMTLPAYGGNLFDPDRFPFLEGRKKGTTWCEVPCDPLPVNNRTVLHLLEALQTLQVKVPGGGAAESRRLSFRALDIEQIGHVYEGLLDHTAKRATEPVLGLVGPRNNEPEIPLAELEKLNGETEEAKKALLKFLEKVTEKKEKGLSKLLDAELFPEQVSEFQAACGNDEKLWKRVKPFAGLVRDDDFGHPVVIPKGSVYVTEGTDRRSSGTHYTPKSLTEPIVQYTLEPLVYIGPVEGKSKEEWKLRTPAEILELNICDMACGSGAFLVQACRYLGERLVEAWEQAEKDHPGVPGITPEGTASTGKSGENLIPKDTDERMIFARRIVAQRCLYGVDKNPLAAEMAKLSLWLLTLQKDKPFTFLDHAIRAGDSLVGIANTHQLTSFSLDGRGIDMPMFTKAIKEGLDAVRLLRREISELPDNSADDVQKKALILRNAEEQTKRLTYTANCLLAACWESTSETDRDERLKQALVQVEHKFKDLPPEQLEVEGRQRLQKAGCPNPLHWPLEFPEVFIEGGGFDGIVGNPPFMGGQKITGHFGTEYRSYLLNHVAGGSKGSADVCSYFFLRAFAVTFQNGNLGLLATNTIAQGDTREVGLARIVDQGGTIYRAEPSRVWPGYAAVFVATCHIHKGQWNGVHVLDHCAVPSISSLLDSEQRIAHPYMLTANADLSYKGAEVYGLGFILPADEASDLIAVDPRNKEVIRPYLDGEAVNSAPDQSAERWVIDFTGKSEQEAAQYDKCWAIVVERVKPQRLALASRNSSGQGRARLWWRFSREVKELYDLIRGRDKVLVIARVSRTGAFVYVSPQQVLNEKLIVFVIPDAWAFPVLQSSLHLAWCWTYSSTLKGDLNYSQTDCFETFPFPKLTGGQRAPLGHCGDCYHETRRRIMLSREEGLTKTYNRFHDPDETATDIQELRDLHVQMDEAVAAAYGWTDIAFRHGFHKTKQGVRFTISEMARRVVLARLLKLNHELYAEEVAQGLHDRKKGTKAKKTSKSYKGPSLFD